MEVSASSGNGLPIHCSGSRITKLVSASCRPPGTSAAPCPPAARSASGTPAHTATATVMATAVANPLRGPSPGLAAHSTKPVSPWRASATTAARSNAKVQAGETPCPPTLRSPKHWQLSPRVAPERIHGKATKHCRGQRPRQPRPIPGQEHQPGRGRGFHQNCARRALAIETSPAAPPAAERTSWPRPRETKSPPKPDRWLGPLAPRDRPFAAGPLRPSARQHVRPMARRLLRRAGRQKQTAGPLSPHSPGTHGPRQMLPCLIPLVISVARATRQASFEPRPLIASAGARQKHVATRVFHRVTMLLRKLTVFSLDHPIGDCVTVHILPSARPFDGRARCCLPRSQCFPVLFWSRLQGKR